MQRLFRMTHLIQVVIALAVLAGCARPTADSVQDGGPAEWESAMHANETQGIEACAGGIIPAAAGFALQASRYKLLLAGYDGAADNFRKAMYYATMANIFYFSTAVTSGDDNECIGLADNVRSLAVRYFQNAYDADERLRASIDQSDRPEIMTLLLLTSGEMISSNGAAALRLQAPEIF